MIALISALANLRTLEPARLPALTLPTAPDIGAALALGRELGADPTTLKTLVDATSHHHTLIAQAFHEASPLIDATRHELSSLALTYLNQAAGLVLRSFSLNPAESHSARTQLMALPHLLLAEATEKIDKMQKEVQPVVDKLLSVRPLDASPASSPEPEFAVASSTSSAGDNADGKRAVAAAKQALGTPYVWGGTSLNGFDCSGFTQWAWRQAGLELPRLAEHQTVGRAITTSELQEGDLLVWDGHVAMYAGDGTIIEAGNPVQINPVRTTNMGMEFYGYYRPTG